MRTSFASIAALNPGEAVRNDQLVTSHLAYESDCDLAEAIKPSAPIAGNVEMPYYHGSKRLGNYPAAVLGMIAVDGGVHAQLIYVARDGSKADIADPETEKALPVKKLVPKRQGDNVAGRFVPFGEMSAPWWILGEGVTTAHSIALAFRGKIERGELCVAACISTSGIRAFEPPSNVKRITVACDRDEDPQKKPAEGERPDQGWRAGERAARALCARLQGNGISLTIALPGEPNSYVDWRDVGRSHGIEVLRQGILKAAAFEPGPDDMPVDPSAAGERLTDDQFQRQIRELAALPIAAYEWRRKTEAVELGVRAAALDQLVKAERQHDALSPGQGQALNLGDPDPWPEPVDGANLLDALVAAFERYLALPPHAAPALALWTLHAHGLRVATTTNIPAI